tara:strand:+ start:250 stop:447 length:198 start_codon:yes stop_codon:yes gene_type:complete
MPTYNIARKVTYMEYYDNVEAESPEKAKELVKDVYWSCDFDDVVDAKEPEILSWSEVIEHTSSPC